MGKVKDAVTDTLGITNTKRDGVKKPKGVKGFFSMQNSHKPEGEMVEGVMDIVNRYRKKHKDEKKPSMDPTTKKLHKSLISIMIITFFIYHFTFWFIVTCLHLELTFKTTMFPYTIPLGIGNT